MRAEVRDLFSTDVDVATYVPADPSRFSVLVRIVAGPAGEPGEESFDVEVCTPDWLADEVRAHGIVAGRHRLIVGAFDWPALREHLTNLVHGCEGENWREVAEKLSRHGSWEFEDHRP